MLEFAPKHRDTEADLVSILREIEKRRGRRVLCFYQDHMKSDEVMDQVACQKFQIALEQMGRQDKLTVLVESAGGDIDCAYRMVNLLRQCAADVEVLVVRWAKSGATFFCLAADAIYMGRDAELGPLDTQLRDPRGSAIPRSALNAFKSLEYLRQYLLETLDQVVATLIEQGGMDIPYALEAARPLVADIVTPLYQQVRPHELGEARRYLAVGEEYSKRVMKRYSYRKLKSSHIDKIVERLVWDYPSHSFVIDLHEAIDIGLSAKPLDNETNGLCLRLLELVARCFGFAPVSKKETASEKASSKTKRDTKSEGDKLG